MAQEAFYEILVKELEKKIRAELQMELRSEPYPDSQLQKSSYSFNEKLNEPEFQSLDFKTQKYFYPKRNPYLKTKYSFQNDLPVTAQLQLAEVSKPAARTLDAENCLHLEILLRLGANLSENYTERDLKREFRKLAMQFHPDQQANHSVERLERFKMAKHSYDKLCKSLEK